MKSKLKKLICAGLACGATFYGLSGAEAASGDTTWNGHTYRVINNGATWQQAKQVCAVMGGHLVTINSASEQQFIESLIKSKGNRNSYWLGGYKSGNTWRWVTGESFSYTHWGQWQPDNDGAALMMYRSIGNGWPLGAWNDLPENGGTPPFFGTQNMGYVCEWDSSQEQTATLADGWYRISPVHASNLGLDVCAAGTTSGTNLQLYAYNGVFQQRFYLQNRGSGYFTLKAGHCDLYVTAQGTNIADNIVMYAYNGSNSQLWQLINTGNGYYIRSKANPNLDFDCANASSANGTNVRLWNTEPNNWRKWKFTKIEAPTNQSVQTTSNSNYDNKVRAFLQDSRYRHGASWGASARPRLVSSWLGTGCNAYARDFAKYVFDISDLYKQGQKFYSVNDIRNGDIIYVSNSSHWFVVLYRNGNSLTTTEGNWTNGCVVYSTNAYTIQNGTLYRNGKKFRTFQYGFHLK